MPARAFPLLFLAVATGCSGPAKEPLYPVAGTITVKGQPLTAGTVVFHPDRDKGNKEKREPRATISSDAPGRYQLSTDNQEGAPAGWYKVTVYAHKPGSGSTSPPEWLVAPKYGDEKTSGLSVEVTKEARSGAYDLKLDPPG